MGREERDHQSTRGKEWKTLIDKRQEAIERLKQFKDDRALNLMLAIVLFQLAGTAISPQRFMDEDPQLDIAGERLDETIRLDRSTRGRNAVLGHIDRQPTPVIPANPDLLALNKLRQPPIKTELNREIHVTIPDIPREQVPAHLLQQAGLLGNASYQELASATSVYEARELMADTFLIYSYEKPPHYAAFEELNPLHAGDYLLVEDKEIKSALVTRVSETTGNVYGITSEEDSAASFEVLLYSPENHPDGWLYKKGQEGAYNVVLFRHESLISLDIPPGQARNPNDTLYAYHGADVLKWSEDILRWAKIYNYNPNIIAGIIRIESSGDHHPPSDDNPLDLNLGLAQVHTAMVPSNLDPFDPEVNMKAAFGSFAQEMAELNERNMDDWGFNGNWLIIEKFSLEEREQAVADLRHITETSVFRYWSRYDEYLRGNTRNMDYFLRYVFTAIEQNPEILDVLLAHMGYHGGSQLNKPYNAQIDRIDIDQERVDLVAYFNRRPSIASSISYGTKGAYFFLLSQQSANPIHILINEPAYQLLSEDSFY